MRVRWPLALGALLVVAALARLTFFAVLGDVMDGDEAVGGLMALKIVQRVDFPLLLWRAHYAGALTSYLGAAVFSLVEPSAFVYRVAALPIALVGIAAVVSTARVLFSPGAALAGGLWLVFGPPTLFTFTAHAVPGYPEVLAFGGLTLWLGVGLLEMPMVRRAGAWRWVLFGLAAGFGIYSNAFVLPLFAGTLWTLHRARKSLTPHERLCVSLGFLAGVSPWIAHNVIFPGATITRLGSRVLDVSGSDVAGVPSVVGLAQRTMLGYARHLVDYPVSLVTNVPAFLAMHWAFWIAAAAFVAVRISQRDKSSGARQPNISTCGVTLVLSCSVLLLIFSWVARLTAVRHLTPFALLIPLAIAAAWHHGTLRSRRVLAAIVIAAVAGNLAATMGDPRAGEPDVAPLIGALDARDVRFVYTDYAIAYPLLFLSRERIVASPAAGPTAVDRYPPYTRLVAAADHPAYVFVRDTEASQVFVREMQARRRAFSSVVVGEFDVYLPEKHVDPAELALISRR